MNNHITKGYIIEREKIIKTIMKLKHYIMIAISCLLWGSAFPVIKISYQLLDIGGDDIGKRMLLAGYRFMLAGIMILLYKMYRNYKQEKRFYFPIPEEKGSFKIILMIGFFQTGLMYFLYYNAMAHTSGVKVAVLSQSGVFFTVILAHFFLHEAFTKQRAAGLFCGIIGIFILNIRSFSPQDMQQLSTFLSFAFLGEGFILLSSLAGSVATIMVKKYTSKMNALLVNGYQILFGGSMLFIVGFLLNGNGYLEFTVKAGILFIYSAIISAVAFSIWFNLLGQFEAGRISVYKLCIPIIGAILSVVFVAGETFTYTIVIGLLFVITGIYICNRKQRG